jgi:hypothetical protein
MSSELESKGSLGTASIPDESTGFNTAQTFYFNLIPAETVTLI